MRFIKLRCLQKRRIAAAAVWRITSRVRQLQPQLRHAQRQRRAQHRPLRRTAHLPSVGVQQLARAALQLAGARLQRLQPLRRRPAAAAGSTSAQAASDAPAKMNSTAPHSTHTCSVNSWKKNMRNASKSYSVMQARTSSARADRSRGVAARTTTSHSMLRHCPAAHCRP